jgi:hypothetical protein
MSKPLTVADRARLHWEFVTARLASPAVELTCEEFAAVNSAFSRLVAAGVVIDAGLSALMACLRRQMMDTLADGDSDDDKIDEFYAEDPNERDGASMSLEE